jgi:Na+/H+ antiporter
VAAVAGVATRFGRTAPLVLVVAGFAASYFPGVDDVRVDPDIILVGVLPPLLYATAIRTSLVAFRANARPIGLLSIGLVVFTTVGVGFIAWAVLPISLAAGFALGAVVAPPDAVAATSIGRRVGLPRRVVTILEGESLVNDATAIVCLRSAIAAMAGGVSAMEITQKFAVSAVGGVVVGLIAAFLIGHLRRRIEDTVIDITISLVTPFVAYLAAEEIHASGVLAVVVCGLLLGHKSHSIQSAQSRLLERGNWTTIQFILEHTVFFLIGLQGRTIIGDIADSELSGARIIAASVAVLLGVVVLRFVWMYPATYLPRKIASIGARDPAPSWQVPTVIAWAGMRGVVTIAAVFLLPDDTPHREVLVLIALFVAAATLLVQGSTLPLLARRLRLDGPDEAQDVLSEARLFQQAGAAGIAALEASLTGDEPPDIVLRLRQRALEPADAAWELLGGSDETPSQAYARLRVVMLEAERAEVLSARDAATAPDEVLRRVLDALDVEESVITDIRRVAPSAVDRALILPVEHTAQCVHLTEADQLPVPDATTPQGCEECLREGLRWVHLRLCLMCGHVGCCDSSVGRHATGHFHDTLHPVMRSFEQGEAWRWCFEHEAIG